MRLLDYTVLLGSTDVDSEVHLLLDRVESVNWDVVPRQNSSRYFTHQRPFISPRRNHRAAVVSSGETLGRDHYFRQERLN